MSPPKICHSLSICPQEYSSFLPSLRKPKLAISILPWISTSAKPKNQNFSFSPINTISIPPKKIYHPAIIKACHSMFEKHPDLLESDEIRKFNHYRNWKIPKREPIEEDIIYLPSGGMKKCLQCNQLT
jgi:hypothetical protein